MGFLLSNCLDKTNMGAGSVHNKLNNFTLPKTNIENNGNLNINHLEKGKSSSKPLCWSSMLVFPSSSLSCGIHHLLVVDSSSSSARTGQVLAGSFFKCDHCNQRKSCMFTPQMFNMNPKNLTIFKRKVYKNLSNHHFSGVNYSELLNFRAVNCP